MKGKNMNFKKIQRECMIPGCRNRVSFMVHKTREPWPDVVMCKDCVKDAYVSLYAEEIEAERQAKRENTGGEEQGVPKVTEISAPKKKAAPKKADGE
jgi:hypothetical protein